MANVVGVRFRPAGRIYYFDPAGKDVAKGNFVIVETTRGIEAGRVVIAPKQVAESELTDPLKPILRQATEDDLRQLLAFKSKEKNALVRCAQRVDFHKLPMKLVEAEYTYDGSRLTFYFTAEERVDFRALVRDLAAQFRTRIELRQIGARDQAKLLGGVGPCGKTLCCSSWLTEFGVVSIKMAKEQGLPLNPAKISGVCGRLMCCLAYENDLYIEAKKGMPAVGAFIDTPSGLGKVIGINVIKQSAEVMLESGATVQVPVNALSAPRRSGGVSCDVGGGNCCKTKSPSSGAGERSGPASAKGDDRLN